MNSFLSASDDASLVLESRAGNREAFSQIVERYQSLLCSVAYSSTGSLSGSEDLAQDAFLAAWRSLSQLREPEKLRPWLCGIVRNAARGARRSDDQEPAVRAGPLADADAVPSFEPLPSEAAARADDAALLWRSIERIPELFREPLILYYREQRSVERVASALGLTQDAVRQRLSRGRKLLEAEVASFVEGALKSSAPTQAFTLGVMSAVPTGLPLAASAAAKGIGAKLTGAGGLLAGMFSGPFFALAAAVVQHRDGLRTSASPAERRLIRRFDRTLWALILATMATLVLLSALAGRWLPGSTGTYVAAVLVVAGAYLAALAALAAWKCRQLRLLGTPPGISAASLAPPIHYRSRAQFLGLPLVHVRIGGSWVDRRRPVDGWISVGGIARGGLFAFGSVAIAPLAIGGLAIGLLPFGGTALGLLAIGGFALGGWAWGGQAIGGLAVGGSAIAWKAALGGVAVAREVSLGALSHAAHANDAVARAYVASHPFFPAAMAGSRHLLALNLVWLLPLVLLGLLIARHRRARGV